MRTATAMLLAGGLLVWGGCQQKVEKQAAEQETQTTPAAEAHAAPVAPGEITVELLDPGAEQRTALRYHFQDLKKQTMAMTMQMTMAIDLGGVSRPPTRLPPVVMEMAIEPRRVTPAGDLEYAFALTTVDVADDPDANPDVVAQMKAELAKTKGMTGTAEVSPRGFTRKADVRLPPGAGAQVKDMIENMKNQIEQMSAPLPEEPVGKGARWVVRQRIASKAFQITQAATYTLKERRDDTIDLGIELAQTAPPQDMDVPGGNARLVSFAAKGSGTSRVDLAKLIPEATLSYNTKLEVEIGSGGQRQYMKTAIDLRFTLQPK